jgi:hypothetical protein
LNERTIEGIGNEQKKLSRDGERKKEITNGFMELTPTSRAILAIVIILFSHPRSRIKNENTVRFGVKKNSHHHP